jgi:aspartate aminotransferase
MDVKLSKRVRNLSQSVTLAVSGKARQMKRQGIDLVDLSAGEPDFPTPAYVKVAGKKAIDENKTKYTSEAGIEELREAVAKKLKKENGLEYSSEDIIITAGAKQAVFNATFSLSEEGDEVLIPSPYWVSYPEIVSLAGANPVVVESLPERDFKVTVEDLSRKVTPRTRGLILNSPNNPSGAVYTAEELLAIGLYCAERGIWIISDEIYERIVYDDTTAPSIARVCPAVKDLTVVVNGLSKTLSMTGWRLGYAAARREIVKAMTRLQSHTTSCVCTISQYAALKAVSGWNDYASAVKEMVAKFNERRLYLLENLVKKCGLSAVSPRGAFYLFFDVSPFFGEASGGSSITGSVSMCSHLLEKARVALVPGIAFGEDHYVRLSYAASMKDIMEGTRRIAESLEALSESACRVRGREPS